MKYTGHQFGHYNPELGDSRGVLLAQVKTFTLNSPTSRALCVIDSDTPVYRETNETVSMIARVSESHIRFDHFEYCSFTEQYSPTLEI
jgi:uncharacterized protein YdiU (UPF0061 family)